ncbi:MAG TPA: 6-bladed beta-propeller [Candidatus Tectomicrobia bacterium]|nr:6-bladed beta-propeller [Candidatus Tectomicrobia bacterium]
MTRPGGRGTVSLFSSLIALVLLVNSSLLASVETRAYRPALTFGQEGREIDQFRQPSSVVVDHSGRLYVADTYNHRIQVFAPDGRFIRAFGVEGAQRGALLRPKGLAWGSTHWLFVADTGNHRVQAFDQQGQVVMVLGSFGNLPGQFNAPEGIAVDVDNTLYIADTQNHRVQKFAPDGSLLLSWGRSGSGKGEFLGPSDIAVDHAGRVLVVDTQNHRVQVFAGDGQYLWEIGKAGRGAAEFDSPRGIATDDQGHIYVADTGNGRVQIFDRSGRYLAHVGHLGKRPGEFYYPASLSIDAQQTLYVADTINHRVQLLTFFPALARLERGWQAFKTAHWDAALGEWDEALKLDPTLAEALYGSGLVYARQGDLDLAVEQLSAALALQPGYSEARWALYRAYAGKLTLPTLIVGTIASALAGALIVRRLRRRVLRERARRLMEEGRIGETIATYERLLQFNRHDLDVCKALEHLYTQRGLESKRQQVNEIIARLEPDNVHALSYLGKQQFAERRFAEAQQTWEKVLHHDATWAEAYFYLGAVQAESGQADAAVSAFQRALSLEIMDNREVADEQRSETDHAAGAQLAAMVMAWEKVLVQGMSSERARASFHDARQAMAQQYVTRGQNSLQRDDPQAAIADLRWVTALIPADDAARALLKQAQTSLMFEHGIRYYQGQDYVQALRCFRETLALDPEHDKAKRYLRYAQQCLEGGVSERFRHLDLGDREKS